MKEKILPSKHFNIYLTITVSDILYFLYFIDTYNYFKSSGN